MAWNCHSCTAFAQSADAGAQTASMPYTDTISRVDSKYLPLPLRRIIDMRKSTRSTAHLRSLKRAYLALPHCRAYWPMRTADRRPLSTAQGREYKGYVPGFPQASVMHCSSACITSGCISKRKDGCVPMVDEDTLKLSKPCACILHIDGQQRHELC